MLGEIILAEIDLVLILAVILAYLSGMVWFHPRLFGETWLAEQPHRTRADLAASMKGVMLFSAIDIVLVAALITLLYASFGTGGFVLFLAAVWVGTYTGTLSKGGSNRLWLVDTGYLTLQYLIILAALALF